ncbi:hypothetical protein PENANT_c010G04230 [Penicillium antarcticum]|uniref:Xylanolytic transcriptional activator regulatory domain-containing protein n=1 Tax=Penicillium antarcticum TaxID=416450 RepID=A0A1V6Q8Z6_9EURO|nr:hypothetical protein PENANT_c010G04230 [Penicillium antarcticum]
MFDDPAFPDIEPPQPDPEEVEKYSGDNPINTSNEKSGRVEHYVHLYFAHFHPHWPFLHRSTFSVPDEPPLLLQAVLMIGLWVSGNPEAQQGARDLHSKLGQAISAQRGNWERLVEEEQDKEPSVGLTSRWPIATYQGILLYIIFSLLASRPVGLGLNLGLILNDSDRQILSALNTTFI